jgi:quinol monooxygenase YgiN
MIIRIVKMTFQPEKVGEFLEIFQLQKNNIAGFEGCVELKLLQEEGSNNIFFTHSIWQSEAHLNAYRNSDFFKDVWGRTKKLFADKPEAWSLKVIA